VLYPQSNKGAIGEAAVRHVDSGSAGPVIELHAIDVEIDALDDFVRLLRGEVTENLRPYSEQVISDHLSGVGFGLSSGSAVMHALRQDYYACLCSSTEGLRSYIEASEVLLTAVEKVAQHYRRSDAMASAQSQDVLAALGLAQQESSTHLAAAAIEDAHSETERESRRGQR
jgi:hypothetical protein